MSLLLDRDFCKDEIGSEGKIDNEIVFELLVRVSVGADARDERPGTCL